MEHQTAVRQAALAEHEAEQTREQAEARWRAAWWATTFALAEPTTRQEQAAVIGEAARILGHSRGWLSWRARTGRAFRGLESTETLPPRLAASMVKAGQEINAAAIDRLRKAEQDGTSLRDFAAEHGGERFETPAAQQVRNMPPEQKAAVVREALAEPEVAERIVRDTPTRALIAKAEHTVDREQQETARERYELAEPRSQQIGAIADLEYALTKARQAFEDAAEATDTLAAHDWPDNSKERAAILTQRALAAGELVRAKVEGRDLDRELQALLEGGDA